VERQQKNWMYNSGLTESCCCDSACNLALLLCLENESSFDTR
jgi:hypothetical protein